MYVCPNCGGNLKFSIPHQKLRCESCETLMDPYDFQKEKDAEVHSDPSTMEMKVYTCPQCGGEILSDDNEAALFCSYCGGSTILDSRLENIKAPDMIIPFKKSKENCKAAYKKLMQHSFFADADYKDEKNIDGFRAIYMPYWIFSFKKMSNVTYSGKKSYRRGDYVYTDSYSLNTDIDCNYQDFPYDASANFSDTLSSAIQPFNFEGAKPFTKSFLSGFYADASDVVNSIYKFDVKCLLGDELTHCFKTNHYNSEYELNDSNIKSIVKEDNINAKLAMLPVWFMSYRKKAPDGNDRVVYALVNGQTGKVVADMPISISKFIWTSLLITIPVFLYLNLIATFKPITLLILSGIMALVSIIMSSSQNKKIDALETGDGDKGLEYKRKLNKVKKPEEGQNIRFIDILQNYVGAVFAIILTLAVILFHPVSDLYYYFAAVVNFVLILTSFIGLIKKFNLLTTRPLPQFKRSGGDDDAE